MVDRIHPVSALVSPLVLYFTLYIHENTRRIKKSSRIAQYLWALEKYSVGCENGAEWQKGSTEKICAYLYMCMCVEEVCAQN